MKNPKFYFISLLCIDYDADLLPFWIPHYKGYCFDEYHIWLHSPNLKNRETRYTYWGEYFSDFGFKVNFVDDPHFIDGRVRARALGRFSYGVDPDDYIISADSDELQGVPPDYKDIAMRNDYDIMKGELVDKWDSTLHNAEADIPLAIQYPNSGNFYSSVFKPEFYPHTNRNKILCSKAKVPVSFTGSHDYARNGAQNYTVCYDYNVDHYTFRQSYPDRMAGKRYYSGQLIKWVQEYFKDEREIASVEAKMNLQKEKGWV